MIANWEFLYRRIVMERIGVTPENVDSLSIDDIDEWCMTLDAWERAERNARKKRERNGGR